jgi:pimeloyl-ACP methyl ester carboxylesterase
MGPRGRTVPFARRLAVAAVITLICSGCAVAPAPVPEETPPMSTTSHRFFASPLGEVHFIDAGDVHGPPLVLLHQTPRSVDEFAEVIPLLAAHHRVIAVDNPGYGASEVPPHQPTVEEYADTVVALLDELQVPKATLVGHHTGAILAVDIAARHPGRVDRLVLSGPHYMDQEMRQLLHEISVQWRLQPDGSHMMEKWEKFSGWVSDPAIVHRVVTDLLRAGETSEYGHFACADYRMEDTLPLVRAPALLIVGRNDPFANHPKNAVFAETIPQTVRVELDGGIFLPTESPKAFAQAVLEYLESPAQGLDRAP